MILRNYYHYASDSIKYIVYLYFKHLSDKEWGKCVFPLRERKENIDVNILANGPSLKMELEEALSHKDRINSVCNYAAFSDFFSQVKPAVYFLADPSFFKIIDSDDKVKELIKILNGIVDWGMTMVVPINSYKKALSHINNKMITVVPVPFVKYEGNEKKRLKLIREGKCAPSFVNVTIFAEYYFLNLGYKKLYLYGVDHTFFDGMYVNGQNQICREDDHFYGKEPEIIKRYKSDGTQWKLSDWIRDKYLTFLEHERMQEYAKSIDAEIINCTEKSLIDAYPRLERKK